ncbi:MAG: hypothetical protein COA74_13595 [Gammaproteobacteria bacterium]|nr:MAG: hypothetical protein COA74_13595 [Gammaproteobacteria bacterium]
MSKLPERYQRLFEIVGASAVIISLLLVVVELNESTKATRAATSSSASQAMMQWYIDVGANAEATDVFLRFVQDPDELTPSQRVQGTFMLHGALLIFQNSYALAKEGVLDESTHQTILEAVVPIKDSLGFRLYWGQRKGFFTPEFQSYIEELREVDRTASQKLYAQEKVE